MATVVKRPGSTRPWQVRWRDHTGAPRSRQFTLKADAEQHATDVERAKQTGRLDAIDAGTQTLREVGADFFALHKREWAQSTARNLAYVWNAYVHDSELAGMQVRAIRKSDVQRFKVEAQDRGVPDGSIRKALGLISRALEHAADDGLIAANPAAGVKRPSGTRARDVQVIPPAGVEAIRGRLGPRDAALVSILAYAGLRPQEVRALELRHVGKRTIRVEAACNPDGSLKRLKGTGGAARTVPLCKALAADLGAIDWPATGPMFARSDGERWRKDDWDRWRTRTFGPAVEAAGVEIGRPYELRHSIASLWLREGRDPLTVASWLGHSLAVLLKDYAHVIAELKPGDRRSVDAMIAQARKPAQRSPSRRKART